MPGYRRNSRFSTWLHSIATRTAIDLWRKDRVLRLADSDDTEALAVLVLGLAGLLGWRLLLMPMPGTGSPDTPLITRQPAEQMEAGRYGATRLRDDHEQQRADWLAGIDQSSEPFDNWQRHLAVWDEAIARVRTGLEYYPEEPVLLAQLESLYQQQMNYLQLVSATETGYY